MYVDAYGLTKERIAGLVEQEFNDANNAFVSYSVASSKAGVGEFDDLGVAVGNGDRDGVCVWAQAPGGDPSRSARLFFFPLKLIFFMGAYGTSFTLLGIT